MNLNIKDIMDQQPLMYMSTNEYIYVRYSDDVVLKQLPSVVVMDRFIFELVLDYIYPVHYKSTYSVANYFVNGFFSGGTINSAFESIVGDIIEQIGIHNTNMQVLMMEAYQSMFKIVNDMYNIYEPHTTPGVISLTLMDLIEITRDRRLVEAIVVAQVTRSGVSISRVNAVVDDILMNDDDYIHNPLCRLYRAGVLNKGQVMQLVGIRGFVTEIDSTIFKYPVLNSFTTGMDTMYELAIESRAAAYALHFSSVAISDAEHLARELQLVGMYLERVRPGDCGTKEYVKFYVTPPSDTYGGDLKNMVGVYYKVGDEVKMLTTGDTHVNGKTIQIRNILKCHTPNKHEVCSVCFGGLSFNVPTYANLGHLTNTTLSVAASQALLSTKHKMDSATVKRVELDPITAKVLTSKRDGYGLNYRTFKGATKVEMVIPQSQCLGLREVYRTKALNEVNTQKISQMSVLTVLVHRDEDIEEYSCTIKQSERTGSLTKRVLRYISTHGLSIDEYDNVIIDITGFKSTGTIIELEDKEYSFFTLVKELGSKIRTRRVLKGGKSSETPEELLSSLFALINKKLNINIANISALVYSYIAQNLPNNNLNMGRGSPDPQLISLAKAIDHRSASAALGHDGVSRKIQKPHMFIPYNKPAHPMDVLYCRSEATDEHNRTFGRPLL